MITLTVYNLIDKKEWQAYLEIFREYLTEQYAGDDDFQEVIKYVSSEKYRADTLEVTGRKQDIFYICKIFKNDVFIGFCDYICYTRENGKCLIGNFYLYPEYRNRGFGTEVYHRIENELIQSGGKYIDLTPSAKAVSFYRRKGFSETEDLSLENGETVWRKIIA